MASDGTIQPVGNPGPPGGAARWGLHVLRGGADAGPEYEELARVVEAARSLNFYERVRPWDDLRNHETKDAFGGGGR